MGDDEQALEKLDEELDEMVPRHIIVNPFGYTLHGYEKAEAAGVLAVLAEHLHELAVQEGYGPEEEE